MEKLSDFKGMSANPYLALLLGMAAVSTGAIFARLADAPALVIAAYRVGLVSIVLVPAAWFMAGDELKRLSRADIVLAMMAGLFLALHFATWISSLFYTSVANSVVLVNTNPLWVGLLTPLITREKIGRRTAVGIALGVMGGVVIAAGDLSIGKGALFGDFLALLGSVFAAFYLLLGRRLRRKLSLLAYISICYASSAVILWAIVLVSGMPFSGFSGGTYAAFFAMAFITQLIGHTSYNWALKYFSAGVVAVSLLGEPVGATILAYFIFGEGLDWAKASGGVLILAAIYIAATGERKKESGV